jgi:uncharacterized protein (TIGR02271 family)
VRLSGEPGTPVEAAPQEEGEAEGFFDWLFGGSISETDRGLYETSLTEGRTAVSVYLANGTPSQQQIEDILERFDPVDIQEEDIAAGMGAAEIGAAGAPMTSGTRMESGEGEQVIPLPKEELEVGKQAMERRTRIKTHVVEQPVEKDVRLHDERVVIERRPTSGIASASSPQEREVEVVEHYEEPVVRKSTKADEELVVRKEEADRTEKVRDTVRRTEVDVDPRNQSAPQQRR